MLVLREKQRVKAVGQALRRARKKVGISAFDLGLRINMAGETIRAWEIGKRQMVLGNFLAVCDALGVTPQELLSAAEVEQ